VVASGSDRQYPAIIKISRTDNIGRRARTWGKDAAKERETRSRRRLAHLPEKWRLFSCHLNSPATLPPGFTF